MADLNAKEIMEVLQLDPEEILYRESKLSFHACKCQPQEHLNDLEIDMDGFIIFVKTFQDLKVNLYLVKLTSVVEQAWRVVRKTTYKDKFKFKLNVSTIGSTIICVMCTEKNPLVRFRLTVEEVLDQRSQGIELRNRLTLLHNSIKCGNLRVYDGDTPWMLHVLDEALHKLRGRFCQVIV